MSERSGRNVVVAKLMSILSAIYVATGIYLVFSNVSPSAFRVGFFAIVAVVTLVGVGNALLGRSVPAIVAGFALFALGYWQANFWLAIVPASFLLGGAGIIIADAQTDDVAPTT
ncbi:hypothetical protein ACFOZ7_06105 [Natribaculum luteum]|uniref:Uncharacterized protein n=1 Tax=Natribaculum luteum TaxID=1586232 RepID=A0ABD5NX99_9EURY|nr:hypothetical protein [Natribaculum luteum]